MRNILIKLTFEIHIIAFVYAKKMNEKLFFAHVMNSSDIKSCRLNLRTLLLFFNFM